MEAFEATTNPFGGIIPKSSALPREADTFEEGLRTSLDQWRAGGYKVVWLELHINRAALVPIAVGHGFEYHHSGENYLMLTRRLVENAFIPPYASHYIGAGGVAINENEELLVVHERGRRSGGPPFYKLPGGALHAGEHLVDGVVREVFEETGIETRFVSLACFRNQHGYRYDKSDIYFVCRLEPLSHEITKQDEEIEDCIWMPLDEYYDAESVSFFNKLVVRAAVESPGVIPNRDRGLPQSRNGRGVHAQRHRGAIPRLAVGCLRRYRTFSTRATVYWASSSVPSSSRPMHLMYSTVPLTSTATS